MGFFSKLRENAEAKKEAQKRHNEDILRIESEIKAKMENSPLVKELVDYILHGEKWIVVGQNLDDTCIRDVSIEWNRIDVEWIGYRYERKIAQDGSHYTDKDEMTVKKTSFVFAEHGFSPLKTYIDSENGIEIPMDRMCYILATILDENMAATIKNYKHEAPGLYFTYDIIGHFNYQKDNPRIQGTKVGWAHYRYMVPDINSQGPLQEWF